MKHLILIFLGVLFVTGFAFGEEMPPITGNNPFFTISPTCKAQLALMEKTDDGNLIENSIQELDNMIRIVTNPEEGSSLRSKLMDLSLRHFDLVKWERDQLVKKDPMQASQLAKNCDLDFLNEAFKYDAATINDIDSGDTYTRVFSEEFFDSDIELIEAAQ